MATKKEYDFITIGSATLDNFIESDKAYIINASSIERQSEFMCFPYGSKVEIDDFSRNTGGGGVNTAMNFANLGFKTTTMIKLGEKDEIQGVIKERLKKRGVATSNIIYSETHLTGFSVILVSFQGDRTVLAHRGANGHIETKDIDFESIKKAKWLYVAPLAGKSNRVLDAIAAFAQENDTNLAINAGTTAIKKGEGYFSKILETAEILVLNKEEAQMLTKINVRPDTKNEKFSKETIHEDIIAMLKKLRSNNEAIVVITDGKNGAYGYDGKKFYFCPQFSAKVRSTLGAGDAFASTFTAAIEKFDWDVEKALKYASVNAASVVEQFGAQEGFLKFNEIEERLKNHPEYKVNIIDEA